MIGVYGGTGFYEFLAGARELSVPTPYGSPSDVLTVGLVDGHEVAFLPRHGRDHRYPPHRIPYRANAWAMKEIGATDIIGPCAVGSLRADYAPGDFVVPDQLVDRTWGREHTMHDGPGVQHLTFAEPYSTPHRRLAIDACREVGVTVHDGGTNVIIQGPRFSTRAESRWFARAGFDIINMTQIPEVPLARELGMDYVNIAVVTDYDAGVEGSPEPVTHELVVQRFAEALASLREVVRRLIPRLAGLRR